MSTTLRMKLRQPVYLVLSRWQVMAHFHAQETKEISIDEATRASMAELWDFICAHCSRDL